MRSQVSMWRGPVIAAALVTAATHIPITEDHFHEAAYLGVLFVVLEVAAVALALLVLRRDDRRLAAAGAVIGALAIAAYVVSRAVGLPQVTDDVGEWTDPLAIVAIVAESVLVVIGIAVATHWPTAERRISWRSATSGAASLLAAGIVATVVAAASEPAMGTDSAMGMSPKAYWDAVGGGGFHSSGVTRTYYISADVVRWDYVPRGRDEISGRPFDDVSGTFVDDGPGRIGSTYQKCLYRGYTDASFSSRETRPADEQYLGILGPVVHAAVGDTIRIVFRNTCPFPASVHAHGVFYAKRSEGAPYADGTSAADKVDDDVPTGGKHTYVWRVPGRAGPGPQDGSSVMWMYHSHSDEIADTYAGLMGPMVITRPEMARSDGTPSDVDREVFAEFFIDNETLSPMLAANERRFGTRPLPPMGEEDDEFIEHNLKHSINGYLYGNMPMITMHKGERVRWYVMAMGTEVDLHTPHWHGNDVVADGMRMDVVDLLPASMVIADMVPDNEGTWLFHCHVNDHIAAGMMTRYRVVA